MPDTNLITIRVGEDSYHVDLFDIDGVEWRDAKRATGMSNEALVHAALIERDFEAAAALVWIWRRRDEAGLAFDDVLRSLSYKPPADDDEPEAPPPPG